MNQEIKDKLKELEKTSWHFRNVSPEEGSVLNIIIKAAKYEDILESGTSNGYSTIWLAEAIKENDGHVTSVEIDSEKADLAEKNFKECNLSEFITLKRGDIKDIVGQLDTQFDLVFIDAGEDYLELFKIIDSKLLKVGGILAMDNAISHREEHIDFINTIESNSNYQTVTIDSGGGLLVAFKKA